jgi:hypothetical protein
MPRRRAGLPFVAFALIAAPGFVFAQSMTPQPAAVPVVLGSTVTAAIGQHTADAVRAGARTALAAVPHEDSSMNRPRAAPPESAAPR